MCKIPKGLSVDDEEHAFHAAIGHAVIAWQMVEGAVGRLFSCVMSPVEGGNAPNFAFYSVINFDTKLLMTHNAISASVMLPATREAWRPLYNRSTRRNARRNLIVHYMAAFDATKRPGFRFYLRPSAFNGLALSRYEGTIPRLTIGDLIASRNAFEKLTEDLHDFATRIAGERSRRLLPPHLQGLGLASPLDFHQNAQTESKS